MYLLILNIFKQSGRKKSLLLVFFSSCKACFPLRSVRFKQDSMDPKVGQVLRRITQRYWSHLYGQMPTAAGKQKKKPSSSLILYGDIPVQTKLFVNAYKQRKVCLSVESKNLLPFFPHVA